MVENATKLPIKTESAQGTRQGVWAPFENLRDEIERVFENFGFRARPPMRSLFDVDLSWPTNGLAMAPAIDVAEKDQEFEITAELPGLDAKDINVTVSDGTLTLKGEKKESKEERDKDYYLTERRYGSFMRSFRLPDTVEADKIAASFAQGVLTLKLPKSAKAQQATKKIEVKAA
jgi:HSP20 family protein